MPALRLKLTRQLLGRLREERVPLEVVRGLARRCFRDCESVRHRGRTHHPRILIFELSVDDGATTCERSRLIPRGSCQRRRHDESSGDKRFGERSESKEAAVRHAKPQGNSQWHRPANQSGATT